MQTYFITANDTDVGKTYVTGLLARHFALQGQSVQVVKVIECGGSGDAQWAADFSGCEVLHTLKQQNIVKGKCLANLHKIILLLQVSFDRLLFHDPAEKERGFREKFQTQKIMMFNFAQKPSSNDAQRKRARQPVARLETIRNRHEHTWL